MVWRGGLTLPLVSFGVLLLIAGCTIGPFGGPSEQERPVELVFNNSANVTQTFEVWVVEVGSAVNVRMNDSRTGNVTIGEGLSSRSSGEYGYYTAFEFPDSARFHGRFTVEPDEQKRSADQGRGPSAAPTDGGIDQTRVASVLLFIVAIALHNMPEGLAVGVGFGSGTRQLGNAIALMLAIGIQNIPEGFAVSVAAVNAGFSQGLYAAFTGIRAGLVEIPLTVFGAWAVSVAGPTLPYAMGFAAGGMLFVISDEIIPETHANGNECIATLRTMAGFLVMLYLDVALG